jgi:hypothetical protein
MLIAEYTNTDENMKSEVKQQGPERFVVSLTNLDSGDVLT